MPEINLLMTSPERVGLLRWTLEQGASVVPDKHYQGEQYETISDAADLNQLLPSRQFWVVRSDWQTEKLPLHAVDNDYFGAGFRISQRYGGPALGYLLYPEHDEEGRAVLGRGSIHYYPHYYSALNNRKMAPPQALKVFFRAVSKLLTTAGVQIKGNRRSVWLSNSALAAVADGTKNVPSEWAELARDIAPLRRG